MGTLFYNKVGFITLLGREIQRFMKVPIQTILAPLISNILYLGIFGGMLRTQQVGIEGVNYLQFLVPGLASMGAIFAAFQNPSFSLVSQKFQNTLQDMNSYPISNAEISLAFILGGTFRGILVGIMTYVSTIVFIGMQLEHPWLFLMALAATSFFFASLGLICGLVLDNFEKMNFVLAIVITPLAYLGGVFFEIAKLPGILSAIRFINPIYPLVSITRAAYLGLYEGSIVVHIALTAVMMLASFLAAIILFNKGVGIKIR
ncbi:ABC transporter permease [Dehalobacter sp. DCM]|uniref:ABC transporter permease n=1 Tax=Dehalobacter sp. DCM TaxID=2907827 RepID=UPI0030815111|nr:ABC transporter permease [Dehalobacter sp. DCM]